MSIQTTTESPARPAKGSERPKAWIYLVLNPLLESLQRTLRFLADGNLTWRAYSGEPEFILAPEGYLDARGRIVLEDLLRYDDYVDFREAIQRNAELLATTIRAAQAAHGHFVSSREFRNQIGAAIEEWRSAFPGRPMYADDVHKVVVLAAERIVNEVDELGSHYVDAEFWPTARDHLRGFRSDPVMRELRTHRTAFADDSGNFVKICRRLRERLCDEFDIPPAPLL